MSFALLTNTEKKTRIGVIGSIQGELKRPGIEKKVITVEKLIRDFSFLVDLGRQRRPDQYDGVDEDGAGEE
jgi:hypothetical protein